MNRASSEYRLQRVLPYGASTYSKSAVAFGPDFPVQASHGDGWRIFVQGRDLCDVVMGLGSVILGHRHPGVDDAIRRQLSLGTALSLGTRIEVEAAERVLAHFPEGYALQWGVNGSDATTGAVRLARAITGRETVVMLDDGYHGFHDWCLAGTQRGLGISSNSSLIRLGANSTFTVRPEGVTPAAAVIIEPDLHPDMAKALRRWCYDEGALLIFDEVMTWGRYPGFRAAAHYGVEPDLTCLGKSLGNGMPVSAIVGPADMLARFAPPPPNAFFSMTWGGHPLSMAAVIATLDAMEAVDGPTWLWQRSTDISQVLTAKLDQMNHPAGIEISGPPWNRVSSPVAGTMGEFRRLMDEHGVLVYASHNLSLAFTDPAHERLLEAWDRTLKALAGYVPPAEPEITDGIMRR
jgi:glutamate-1-semialdehyde aminotransferase